ncbi:Protein-glutamate O-methyltransferase [Tolypocladium capitatum]|uniref:Sugar phosphate phosphatase n=1 Tax=Tolypocladium capitatum TaxID=45235 RepID=A0A2K3QQ81_9HYPO|nr:Protein-glutamate O-methyltransferase [Tolypocladium capitatum]
MQLDAGTPQYMTSDPTSFASNSVRQRWPIIIVRGAVMVSTPDEPRLLTRPPRQTGAVDDVYRAVSKTHDPEKQAEGKKIIEQLGNLKYEVQHDRKLSPIADDGYPDEVAAYNKEIADLGNPSWLHVPWLFSECYMYRRISSFFQPTKHWKNYDVFARQKTDSFRGSRNAVLELASRYKELVEQLRADKDVTHDDEAEKLLFAEFFDICLWGNATDLSLLTSLTYEDIQQLQGSAARKAAEKNILVNDLPASYEILHKARAEGQKERRVDFVLDNAGFELYVDLALAGFLLSSGLATQVILRPKSIPWFVSDVLPGDFSALLNAISNPKAFFETQTEDEQLQGKTPEPVSDKEVQDLVFVFQEWANLHVEGRLIMRPNRYWTAGGSFWRLPHQAPELYEDLRGAELVIFKGDLNYRKLTGDARWDPTTPFQEALGPMGKGSGVNVLSLRTCKADVVVGLPAGKDEELKKTEGGGGDSGARTWAWHGKWAVVCLSQRS